VLPEYRFLQEWMEGMMEGLKSDHDVMPPQNGTDFMREANLEEDLFVGVGYIPPEWARNSRKMRRVWFAYGERDTEAFDWLMKGIGVIVFSKSMQVQILKQAPMKKWRGIAVDRAVRWLPPMPMKVDRRGGSDQSMCWCGWDFGRREELNKKIHKQFHSLIVVKEWGRAREERLMGCAMLVNIHAYEWWPQFEFLRIMTPWYNGLDIVSEESSESDMEFMEDTVHFAPYDKMVEKLAQVRQELQGQNMVKRAQENRKKRQKVWLKIQAEYDETLKALRTKFAIARS